MSKNDLAFMFESTYVFKLTRWANEAFNQQTQYFECWMPLKAEFNPALCPPTTPAECAAKDAAIKGSSA